MMDYQFITGRLAVGGSIGTTENMQAITQAGITHIVNMQSEFDDRVLTDGTGVQILWNGCEDDFLHKPPELFWKGVLFTLDALQDPQAKVLFHCAAGIHRSPLMLLAALRVLGYDQQTAMEMIVAARPQADFPLMYLESMENFVEEFEAWRDCRESASGSNGHGRSHPQ